jgi:uncharacterized protein YceK
MLKTIIVVLVCATLLRGSAATNIALNKPATQSSTHYTAYASRAVDGNTATGWGSNSCTATHDGGSGPLDFEPWLRVDLQAEYTLTSVKLWNRGDCCPHRLHDISIYIGNDASAFGNNPACATNVDIAQTNLGQSVPCVGTGRYLWVAIPGKTECLTICELEAYGTLQTPAPPTPAPTQDPAVAAFCDGIATQCTALDSECATLHSGIGAVIGSGTMSNQAGNNGIGEQTGGVVLTGNTVVVTASGTLGCGPGCPNSPNGGTVGTSGFLLNGVNRHSLIARVGSGPWQFIGSGPTPITGTGALTFAFNDDGNAYGDNYGSWDIKVHDSVENVANDCDASVAACNDVHADCQAKVASCPIV